MTMRNNDDIDDEHYILRQEIDKIVSREKDASLNENEKSLKIQE